jgi:adenylate cyclase
VKYVYTLFPDPKDPTKFYFGVDAEESTKDLSHAGDPNDAVVDDDLPNNTSVPYTSGRLVRDHWGVWLTGYAPILNSKGNYIGTVGVDISSAYVNEIVAHLLVGNILVLVIGLVLSFLGAFYLAKQASESLHALAEAAQEVGKGNYATRVTICTKDEFYDLGESFNAMCVGLQEKEKIKMGFAHYVSQHVLDRIVKEGMPKLGGERRKITVFFCDIIDFTTIAEKMEPEAVMGLLNEYFQAMLEIIFKHDGMIDKLIGDAIMAEFGFLKEDSEQEKKAVLTALEMQNALAFLRAKWKKEGKPELRIGIGIHTGEAIVGTLGSKERLEFTAIGDTVNIASRLEHMTRELNVDIIVSEDTYKGLEGTFESQPLGSVQLHGKEQPINAYAINRFK